jgi:hypothetical protein
MSCALDLCQYNAQIEENYIDGTCEVHGRGGGYKTNIRTKLVVAPEEKGPTGAPT